MESKMNFKILLIRIIFTLGVFIFQIYDNIASNIVIISNPKNAVLCKGTSFRLSIEAKEINSKELIYCWYKDGERVKGETKNILYLEEVNYSHTGNYFCRVITNDFSDSLDSSPASIYVSTNDLVSIEPLDYFTNEKGKGTVAFLSFGFHANLKVQIFLYNGLNFLIRKQNHYMMEVSFQAQIRIT
jgi:hypothetical protein